MRQLITGTTAYAVFSGDVASGKISHAYLLRYGDAKNLRAAMKIFALRFFDLTERETDGRRLFAENFPDCRIFPAEGKKLTAEAVSALLEDSVLRPVEREKKLYLVVGFEQASALLQNKLLKTLEEPPCGATFLLGATGTASVLDTVMSRVKTLTIPPFSENEIFGALERERKNPLNRAAAASCAGVLGTAQNIVGGGWFGDVVRAAREICLAKKGEEGVLAAKHGDTPYKTELLSQMQGMFFSALRERSCGAPTGEVARRWQTPALIYALESVDKAAADIRFNAFFQGLLYDLMLRINEENEKWLKLQA